MNVGPDAARYLYAGIGTPVPRPFHLRWLLPKMCTDNHRAWWAIWAGSWIVLAASMVWWQIAAGAGWQIALCAAGLLVGLPGILGPAVSIPVQVDLPATALIVLGCAVATAVDPVAAVPVFAVAASIRETSPVWAALWLWSLWPLVAIAVVIVAAWKITPGPDPLGDKFQHIADHPIRTALEHHAGQWRDAWVMVAPWGICLLALYQPDWRLLVIVAVAYAQLLVATDTVRLVQHGAGAPMAIAAATVIPIEWMLLAVVAHAVWWWQPERI